MATRIKTQFKNNKQGWTSKLMTPKGVNTPYIGSYMNSKLGDVKVNPIRVWKPFTEIK